MKTPMSTLVPLLVAGVLVYAAAPAHAGPKCTTEPQSSWLTEDQMLSKIQAMGYTDPKKTFHVSKGKCYEIYGYDKQNRKVEVYFHPITGEIAESNFK
jgi:hypothetical protein